METANNASYQAGAAATSPNAAVVFDLGLHSHTDAAHQVSRVCSQQLDHILLHTIHEPNLQPLASSTMSAAQAVEQYLPSARAAWCRRTVGQERWHG